MSGTAGANSFNREKMKRAFGPLLLLIVAGLLLFFITKKADPSTVPAVAIAEKVGAPLKTGAAPTPEAEESNGPRTAPPPKRRSLRDLTQTNRTLSVPAPSDRRLRAIAPTGAQDALSNLPDLSSVQQGAQTAIQTMLAAIQTPPPVPPAPPVLEVSTATLYKGTTLTDGNFGQILIKVYLRETGQTPPQIVDFVIACSFSSQAKTAQLQCPEFIGGTHQRRRHQTPTRVFNAFLTGMAAAGSNYINTSNTVGFKVDDPDITIPVTSYSEIKPGQPVLLLPVKP